MALKRVARKVAISVAGTVVILVGLAGVVLPVLPGPLLIIAGLGILAMEFEWAERRMEQVKDKVRAARDKVRRR